MKINFLKEFLLFNEINIDIDIFIKKLENHSNFPTILSISDTLNHFKIPHLVLKINKDELYKLPNNFIALTKDSDFSNQNTIHFFIKENNFFISNSIKFSHEEFSNLFLGIILIKDDENVNTLKKSINYNPLIISFIPILIFNIYPLFSILLSSIIGVCLSLISIDLFQNNFIKKNACNKDCSEFKKNSKWLIFKIINFSNISISYFITQLAFIILNKYTTPNLINETSFLVLASMAIIFATISLFYQIINKTLCMICISLAIILFFQVYFFFSTNSLFSFEIFSIIVYIGIQFFLYIIFTKLSILENKYNILKSSFYNPETFFSILKDSPQINIDNDIKLYLNYDENNTNEIIIVTNPFCSFCSLLQKDISKEIKNNKDINVGIIFNPIVFTSEKNQNIIKNSINSYIYSPSSFFDSYSKTIQNWNTNYINNKLINEKFGKMEYFCVKNNLKEVPMIFINNKLYPKQYNFKSIFKLIK